MSCLRPSRTALALVTCGLVAVLCGCGCSGSSAETGGDESAPNPTVPAFDGACALELIQTQCDFGPRTPGSKAHAEALVWLLAQLRELSGRVLEQRFSSETSFGGPYDFCNVLAWLGPQTGSPLLLAAHWDSRPTADEDPDPANHNSPVLGANDGASGVAVLLEMARLMAQTEPPRPILLAFLDAEDSGSSDSDQPYSGFCVGSAYLAEHWPEGWAKPAEGILLDLVGGDGKPIPRIPVRPIHGAVEFDLGLESNSLDANPKLVNQVWSQAEALGHKAFVRKTSGYITDDHVPLIRAGIKIIDIIEVFPLTWHTVDDTPEHCSADSLYQVGDTLMHVIYGGS